MAPMHSHQEPKGRSSFPKRCWDIRSNTIKMMTIAGQPDVMTQDAQQSGKYQRNTRGGREPKQNLCIGKDSRRFPLTKLREKPIKNLHSEW